METGPFIKQLRDQVSKATGQAPPWGDVNPLVVIGLTETILDLGLNESQMYPVVRGFLRQLAAQVHPDRNPVNVSAARQRQILAALNYLDDHQNFSRALDHFRSLKAEDRREIRILSQSLVSLRRQVTDFESRWDELQTGRKRLEADQRAFDQQKKEEPLLVPDLDAKIKELRGQLGVMEIMLRSSREASANWKRRFEHIAEYLAYMGKTNNSKYSFGVHVLDAKWVAVASLWPLNVPNPSPLEEDGTPRPDFISQALSIVQKKGAVSRILKLWKRAVATVGTSGKMETRRMPLGLSILRLDNGKPTLALGHIWTERGGRVIGCLPPDKIPVARPQMVYQTAQSVVFETLHPFIVTGGLLVSVSGNDRLRASWSTTCPAIRFRTKRLILAVG